MKKVLFKYSTFVILFFLLFTISTYAFACGLCADTYTHSFVHSTSTDSSSNVKIWSSTSNHPPICSCASHKEGMTYSKRLQRDDLIDLVLLPNNLVTCELSTVDQVRTVKAPGFPTFISQALTIHRTVVLLN